MQHAPRLARAAEEHPSRAPLRTFTCPSGHPAEPVRLVASGWEPGWELELVASEGRPPLLVLDGEEILVHRRKRLPTESRHDDAWMTGTACLADDCRNQIREAVPGWRCGLHRDVSDRGPGDRLGQRTRFVCTGCRDAGKVWDRSLTGARLLSIYLAAVRDGDPSVSLETARPPRCVGNAARHAEPL